MTEEEFVKTFGGPDRSSGGEIADRVRAALGDAVPDLRPPWIRWLDRHRRPLRVTLSIAWFVVSLSLFLWQIAEYGWDAPIRDHLWLCVGFLGLAIWTRIGVRMLAGGP